MNARQIARSQQRWAAARRQAARRAAEKRAEGDDGEGGATRPWRTWAVVVYEAGGDRDGGRHRVAGLYPSQAPADAAAHIETLRGLDELRYGGEGGYMAAFAAPCRGGEAGGPEWWPSLEGTPGEWRVVLHASEEARTAAVPAVGSGVALPPYSEPGREVLPPPGEGGPI